MPDITEQRFGVEIEVAGASRRTIADAVAEAVAGRIIAANAPGGYDATIVTDAQGREWKVQNDSSIAVIGGHRGSEVVSPVLTYSDIPILQEVARKVKAAGGVSHSSTSVHIHVDARPHTPQTLANLAKMVYKNEDLLFDALQVRPERRARFARPMEASFIGKVANSKPKSARQLNEYWYGSYNPNPQHYDNSRYHGLNLNNLSRDIGTIEFRYYAQQIIMRSSQHIRSCHHLSLA